MSAADRQLWDMAPFLAPSWYDPSMSDEEMLPYLGVEMIDGQVSGSADERPSKSDS